MIELRTELDEKVGIMDTSLTAAHVNDAIEQAVTEMDREELIAGIHEKVKSILRDRALRYANLTQVQLAEILQATALQPEILSMGKNNDRIVGFLAGAYYVGTDRALYSVSSSTPWLTSKIKLDKLPIGTLRRFAKSVQKLS